MLSSPSRRQSPCPTGHEFDGASDRLVLQKDDGDAARRSEDVLLRCILGRLLFGEPRRFASDRAANYLQRFTLSDLDATVMRSGIPPMPLAVELRTGCRRATERISPAERDANSTAATAERIQKMMPLHEKKTRGNSP